MGIMIDGLTEIERLQLTSISDIQEDITNIESALDLLPTTIFVQDTEPESGMVEGDLWVNTSEE